MIYEEPPDRLPDESSIDRKCTTIEIKKKRLDARIGSAGNIDERKRDKMKKAQKHTRRTKNAIGRYFLPHCGNQTYSRSEIGIELKSWPSQLKRFAKVQEILPRGNGRVSRRGSFFFPHYVVCRLVVESDAIKPTVLPYKYRIAGKIEGERSPARCGQSFCLISERFIPLRSLYRLIISCARAKFQSCNVSILNMQLKKENRVSILISGSDLKAA